MKSAARLVSMREQWPAKQKMAVSRNDHILMFGEVFKTSLTSWNSFNVWFAILLTLCYTWPTIPKPSATPTKYYTNSNAHMWPVSSVVIEVYERHTLRIHTPSSST